MSLYVTISLGVAVLSPDKADNRADLIGLADKALSEQRKKGEIECVNRKNDNMENDRFRKNVNTSSLKGDENCNADPEGMNDYLSKPVEVESLTTVLKRLRLHHLRNEPEGTLHAKSKDRFLNRKRSFLI